MADNSIGVIPPNDSFVVAESTGFKKQILWTVNLTETQAEFICQGDERTMIIPSEKACEQIKFVQMVFAEGTPGTVSGS